jgi:hypothetical protein
MCGIRAGRLGGGAVCKPPRNPHKRSEDDRCEDPTLRLFVANRFVFNKHANMNQESNHYASHNNDDDQGG